MKMKIFLQSTLCLTLLVSVATGQFAFYDEEEDNSDADCVTPDAKDGNCVSLGQCPGLIAMLKRPVSARVKRFLRESVCGGFSGRLPNVCCAVDTDKGTRGSIK